MTVYFIIKHWTDNNNWQRQV